MTKRNSSGQFRTKRGDTKIGTIERQYKVDFGVRSDMKLSTYLDRSGTPSLSKVLNKMGEKK